jgi:mannose-6-phosphate isomerase-like protein (cupin superfamily)
MSSEKSNGEIKSARFNLEELALRFPEQADTLLLDRYLVDRESASVRIFRVYRGTPPHYHVRCDEHLYVLSGKGTFWMEDPKNGGEFIPGCFLFFRRGTVHALPKIVDDPVVFLSIDVPRRDPDDIIFVDPVDGSPRSFVKEAR